MSRTTAHGVTGPSKGHRDVKGHQPWLLRVILTSGMALVSLPGVCHP